MTILVLGQERTGTHTLTNMLNASGIEAVHEANPTLCFEAYSRVVKGSFRQEKIFEKINQVKGKAEANHRLQFFADIFAKEIPDAKFVFVVRDPIHVITSLIGTFAYWPGRTELPRWYLERIEKYVRSDKSEFNLYRVPYEDRREPFAIKHLQSWLKSLEVSLPLLEKLEDRLFLLKTGKICPDGHKLWQWLGLDWTESVTNCSCEQFDSMYNIDGNKDVARWAHDQVVRHTSRIHNEFNKTLLKYSIGKKILDMIYH